MDFIRHFTSSGLASVLEHHLEFFHILLLTLLSFFKGQIFYIRVINWLCGVNACENMQKLVSHGETVRVGSSECMILVVVYSD